MIDGRRPWWGNPLVWLGIAAVFVLLGLFVFPKLFGGVFLFLPFFWLRGWRRPVRRDPVRACASCGRSAEAGHAFCPACGSRLD